MAKQTVFYCEWRDDQMQKEEREEKADMNVYIPDRLADDELSRRLQ
jgi:hypothetical protein